MSILALGKVPRIGDSPPKIEAPEAPAGASLAGRDTEYLRVRGVSRETAEAAGLYTATRPAQIPGAFSQGQRRRAPALVAPHLSPSGAVGWQKRDYHPGKDRKGRPIKWASPPKERASVVLAVHPWTADEARTGTGPLWLPEGLTRMLALAELGIPAASYAGAYNWQKGGEPLECFDHLNLPGRVLYDVPDADYRTNEQVHDQLAERTKFLESRGARVLVVSVPEVNGKRDAGLDDFIGAGGDPLELARNARPFEPVDVGRERLRKDERLRSGVALVRRSVAALESRTRIDCSALAVARYMVEESATKHGKARERGVKVRPSLRQIAAGVRIGGLASVKKALEHLEGVGFMEPVKEKKRPNEAASYLLLYPWGGGSALGEHIGGSGARRGEGQEHRAQRDTLQGNPLTQRDSLPRVHSTHIPMKSATGHEKPPPLRNSKLVHTYARKEGRRVVVHSDYFRRYDKKGEAIFRYVLEGDGAGRVELHEKFGSRTSRLGRFWSTWVAPMLKDGVLVEDGAGVVPAPDWPEALERVRGRTDEEGDNRRQDRKYKDQSEAFRRRHEGPPGDDPGHSTDEEKAHYAEIRRRNEERDRERVEAERRQLARPAEDFVLETFAAGLERVRLGLLEDLWRDRGGLKWHLRLALRNLRCRARPLAEHPGELFVHPPEIPPSEAEAEGPDEAAIDPPDPAPKARGNGDVAVLPMSKHRKESGPENLSKLDIQTPPDERGRCNPHPTKHNIGDGPESDVSGTKNERDAERRGAELYVKPTKKTGPDKGLPKKVAGVHLHGPECECWLCEDDMPTTSYAGIGGTA